MDNNILVQNLCKQFEGFSLDNVSFKVPKGRIVGFIGENGAGKSTTINLILNELNKDSGQTGYNLSSRNLIWDAGRVGLVVSHNGVNDGDHLPASVAHGRHVGLPFIPFFLEIKLQRRIVKYRR